MLLKSEKIPKGRAIVDFTKSQSIDCKNIMEKSILLLIKQAMSALKENNAVCSIHLIEIMFPVCGCYPLNLKDSVERAIKGVEVSQKSTVAEQ